MAEQVGLLTQEHLNTLDVGMEFESPSLLEGVCPKDKIVWRLVEMSDARTDFIFALKWKGVELGDVSIVIRSPGKIEIEQM